MEEPGPSTSTSKENESQSQKEVKQHSSAVWGYFKKIDTTKASCNKCNKIVNTPTGSTTNLARHLNTHPALYTNFKKAQKELEEKRLAKGQSTKNPLKQQKLTDLSLGNKWGNDHPKSKVITKKIATWLAKSCHPYSLVEEQGFKDLMKEVVPLYQIPSRVTFSRNIIPKLFNETKTNIKSGIGACKNDIKSLSFTSDLWTSEASDSFLSLTLHFMTKEFDIKRYSLGTLHFPEEHTSDQIRTKIFETISEWELDWDKCPTYMTTDNARNITSAFDQSSINHIPCFAHTLQLCISDVKQEIRGMQSLLAKCRAIVGHYKHSPKAMRNLEEFQKMMKVPCHTLYQDIDTRWNSEFIMLERLIEQRGPISAELAASDSKVTNLTSDEWAIAESYVKILQPIHHATHVISEDVYPTLSCKFPILYGIDKYLSKAIQEKERGSVMLARALQKSLLTRFPLFRNEKLTILSMVVDPRFKAALLQPHEKEIAKKWLIDEVKAHLDDSRRDMTPLSVQKEQHEIDPLFHDLDEMINANTQNLNLTSEDSLEIVVNAYLSTPCITRKDNPCEWWKKNHMKYDTLSPVAMKYLPIPATSVASERLFSAAGNVVTKRRHNLLTDHIEELVFLHENL